MKSSPPPRQFSFRVPLERIAVKIDYFAFTAPEEVSRALGRGPVPVSVRLNDAVTFRVSMAPIGGGRHWLRVNAKARQAANLKEGELVQVTITVVDRESEISLPPDLGKALKAAGLSQAFDAIPIGARSFLLRRIAEVAKPETRLKRIQEAVDAAHARKSKQPK